MKKPQQLKDPNLSALRESCQAYIDFIAEHGNEAEYKYTDEIFEVAVQAIFGFKIFEWVNNTEGVCESCGQEKK